MPTSKRVAKINRRRNSSMKNKKYYAGDYAEHIIKGQQVKCIYPDSSDKSFAAMLGFRKNCSSIDGFVPPVASVPEKPIEEPVTTPQEPMSSMSSIFPEETAPATTPATTPALVDTVPSTNPVVMPTLYTNTTNNAPKGGSKRVSKKSKKSKKNNSKKSKKSSKKSKK